MLLTKMHDEGALLGCGSVQHLAGTDELTVAADGKSVLPEGIVLHHAYSILDVKHGVDEDLWVERGVAENLEIKG